ncbi:hypothetical protein B0H17DRAFT_1215598 [Mycena rosella]|uniref:Uncharacterized protein n=1 Tax=Mycena rosella TaxID=1033263 RepID=A0AAD7CH20_MYCRO|nr:hypothetical protein B0H17DRAFT_1215598 [Mycena rosella]
MRLYLLPIGLLALLAAVAADDNPQSDDDLNSLNNQHGMSPCDMKQEFQVSCKNQRRARDDSDDNDTNTTRVTPTPCTCTNLYFNLWSACVYTQSRLDNSSLPLGGSLEDQCAQASINITTEPPPQAPGTYPDWAYTHLPSTNGTFDPVAAIEVANGSKLRKWTTVQIALPIISVFTVLALCVLGICCYRRRKILSRQGRRGWMETAGNRPRFQFPTRSSAHKVREQNRSNSWSIDEGEEDLDEYQFVSYPASLQGSQVSGHVRLSSSSSGTQPPGPPMLKIPADQKAPVRTWPGKSLWKGPLQSAQKLTDAIPLPWKSARRVHVKSVPSYSKFRVDASDSDSPLSRRPKEGSLPGRNAERARTNLNQETIFESDDEDDSDSDAEAFPLMPQEHSHSNHDAQPPPPPSHSSPAARPPLPPSHSPPTARPPLPPHVPAVAPPRSPPTAPPINPPISAVSRPLAAESPDLNGLPRSVRQNPPSNSPPNMPLPPPPQVQPRRSNPTLPLAATSPSSPQSPRLQRTYPSFPPAPTSPPPAPPPVSKSPRSSRFPLSPQSSAPPLPFPPALSPGRVLPPPPSQNSLPSPPAPRSRPSSEGGSSIRSLAGSSVRSLPLTPTPPYVRGAPPAPIQVLAAPPDPINRYPAALRPALRVAAVAGLLAFARHPGQIADRRRRALCKETAPSTGPIVSTRLFAELPGPYGFPPTREGLRGDVGSSRG